MEAEVQSYLTEFRILRGQIRDSVTGLDDAAAGWRPLPKDTNSIYVILTHLVGSQSHWVRKIINGEQVQRDRDAEFRATGSLADVLTRWEKVSSETDAILGKLTLAQLSEARNIPKRPELGRMTVRWCILHLLSHQAIHLGHIELTTQAWEQRR